VIPALLVSLLVLAALAWVTLPLRLGPRVDAPQPARALEEARARKKEALLAILDLENERATGKLSESDFGSLRLEYEARALTALREVDALRDSTVDDDELEAEIAALKERLRCPNCGASRPPGGPCDQCGA
jgi:cytochrome c-type biogenesis protein CcmH/NrfF